MEKEPLSSHPRYGGGSEAGESVEGLQGAGISSGTGTAEGLDVNQLQVQYGQAMARVGQLESRVRALEQTSIPLATKAESEHPGPQAPLQNLQEELQQKERTIASLNLQIAALKAELNEARAQLNFARDSTRVRRRRRHHRKWWHFWGRRR